MTGRPKHLWSIYKKMKQREKPYEEIYDLLAIRVLVNSVPDCYHALGVIHDGWTPVQERIKDYIAQPKSNGYQSLHTTVFGPGGSCTKCRSARATCIAPRTSASRRTGGTRRTRSRDELDRHLSWFRQVLELQMDAKTPDEFLEFLKLDLYQDEIFVFTPTGDVIQLPKGATPLDFAFAVHTEIGLHCRGRASQRTHRAALARAAQFGDGRDHHVDDGQADARLARARPHRAARATRSARSSSAKRRRRPRSSARRCSIGRSSAGSLAKPTTTSSTRPRARSSLTDATHLLASIGQGDVNVTLALKHLYPDAETRPSRRSRTSSSGSSIASRGTSKGVRIQGVDGLMVRYAQCCQPVPGDPVVGYVTRGRGVSIHRARLSQPAAPRARAGAATRDRLAGGARRAFPRPPRARGQRPPRPLRRRRRGGQCDRHGHQEHGPPQHRRPDQRARCSSRSRTSCTSRRSFGRRGRVKGVTDVARRERLTDGRPEALDSRPSVRDARSSSAGPSLADAG